MSYNTNDIMGYAQDPIVFSNEQGGNELYEKVKEVMVYGINENGLPATMFEDTIKSGGMFGTKCPLLMIRHSDSSCRFFMIGIFVYGNQVMFALFGESAENTKYNRKQYYQENGNFTSSYDEDQIKGQVTKTTMTFIVGDDDEQITLNLNKK